MSPFIAGAICCFSALSVAANVNISLDGTVGDGKGAPVAGAIVTLASDTTLKDTTNEAGEFLLSNSTILRRTGESVASSRTAGLVGIRNNRLHLSLASACSRGAISLFSCDGRRSVLLPLGGIKPGEHTLTLPELTPGFHVLHITIDGSAAVCKLVAAGGEILMGESGMRVGFESVRSAVAPAEGGAVDTLIVNKDGFAQAKSAVSSHTQTGISIVLVAKPVYAYSAAVENTCADCLVPELPDADALTAKNSKLPDPFRKPDGSRITKKSEWRCQRQLILRQAMKYIYGEKPMSHDSVTGTVTSTSVTVRVAESGKTIEFSNRIVLPKTGEAPYPAIINLGSGFLTIGENRITVQGVAVIYYDYGKVGTEWPDGQARGKDNRGLFYDLYGGKHSAGLLTAWAWGASRMIDVLQASGGDIIDVGRLGVTGCSRTAKGAFAVGLFDERIALALPHETSIGGVPAYRYADAKCQENTQNNFNGQTWLSNDFKPFVMNTALLPLDAHSLVATYAPRGLYIMENPAAAQMCAPGGYLSVMGGADVYNALGAGENLSYNSKTPGGTGHCTYVNEFTDLLIKNIRKFLKHESAETGKIEAGSTVNRTEWIDWSAPALEDDTELYRTGN